MIPSPQATSMLVIRDAQMDALSAQRRQQFEDAAVARLSRAENADPASVRAAVLDGIREASAMGLQSETDIMRWLEATQARRDRPVQQPADELLSDPELTPSLKLRLLELASAAAHNLPAPPAASYGGTVAPCPLQKEKTWIAIQLVGEDDRPIGGVPYRVVLSDGSVQEGVLDAAGNARVDGIEPGTCVVTFPGLDRDAWEGV